MALLSDKEQKRLNQELGWAGRVLDIGGRLSKLDTDGSHSDSTLTADELAAIQGAASPDAENVFATMADVVAGDTLADGKLLIGNASNEPTAVTLTGDVTVTNAGVTAIGVGKVTNAKIASASEAGGVAVATPVVLVFTVDGDNLSASYTVPEGRNLLVLDASIVKTHGAGASGDTVRLFNGETAITNAQSLDVADKARVAFGTFDDAQCEVAAGDDLVCTAVEGGSDCDCTVTVLGMWVSAA